MTLPVGPLWSVLHIALKFPAVSAVVATVYFTSPMWQDDKTFAVPDIDPELPMVAITFDDGYRSVLEIALPEMQRRGMVATNYITSSHLNFDFRYINYDEVELFANAGWEIGSHGVTHVDMTTLTSDEIVLQLSDSRKIFETLTDSYVTSFSSPLGAINPTTVSSIGKIYENHVNAFSPKRGMNTLPDFDALNIHRIDYANTNVDEICKTVKTLPKDSLYVLIMHNISEEKTHPRDIWMYDISPDDFRNILDCVQAANVNVARISDAVNSMKERAADVGF